jgi:hypothetical protein
MIFILFSMNFRTLKEFPGIFNWITNLEKGKGMNRCGLTIDIRQQLAAFLAQSMTLRGGPAVRSVRRLLALSTRTESLRWCCRQLRVGGKIGHSSGGEHRRDRALPPGKVVDSGAHPNSGLMIRVADRSLAAAFNDGGDALVDGDDSGDVL